jgi:D-tyrosyl-tRNA(Tyr) deacylase
MRAVIQRVSSAEVSVNNEVVASIGVGYLILVGIGHSDTVDSVSTLARKTALLRIFEDEQEKMNLSVVDTHGEILLVSQFTLYADTRRGNRPSFTDAANPEIAAALVEAFADSLRGNGLSVQQGVFGARMQVSLVNNGPVTIILEG